MIILSCMLIISITAFSLMSGYLKKQEDIHLKEQKAVDATYPIVMDYRKMIDQTAAEYNLNPAFVTSVILNDRILSSNSGGKSETRCETVT